MKIVMLVFALAACGGKQSSNSSSAGGAPPPGQDTTSDHMNVDGGEPLTATETGGAPATPAPAPNK
jgi:hypothetical protein